MLQSILFQFFTFLVNLWLFILNKIDEYKPKKKDKIEINTVFFIRNNKIKKQINTFNKYNPWHSIIKQEKYIEENDILEIDYTVCLDNKIKKYLVYYKYPNKVIFPPYKLKELKNAKNNKQKKILFGECDDKDFTDICVKYAGPFQDFYKNICGIEIKKSFFITSEKPLIITDGDLCEREFTDILSL